MATKPSLASLPSARAISCCRRSRSAAALRASASRSTRSPARISTLPPGIAHGRRRLARRSARSRRARRATSAADAVEAVDARGQDLAGLHAGLVAPGAQRLHGLDHGGDLGLGRLVAQGRVGLAAAGQREQALGARDVVPQLLGDERDHRVRERERLAQHVQHRRRQVGVELAALRELEVPVAQLAVDEVVEAERGLGEVEAGDAVGDAAFAACRRERIQRSSTRRRPRRGVDVLDVEQHEARGVEELVRQALALLDLLAGVLTSWVEDIASRPKRTASAPWRSISSSGSMPVPSDLLIRRPSGAWMTECT